MRLGRWSELLPAKGCGWYRHETAALPPKSSRWRTAQGLQVMSTMADLELPGSGGLAGPTWHVSGTRIRRNAYGREEPARLSNEEMARVITDFGIPTFDEDNHTPGVARHVFCPIEDRWRHECECKLDEEQVVELDGYRWSRSSRICGECVQAGMLGALCREHGAPPAHAVDEAHIVLRMLGVPFPARSRA